MGPKCGHKGLKRREASKSKEGVGHAMTEARRRTDAKRGHEPRSAGGFQKLEKEGNRFSQETPEGTSPAHTLTLAH